MPGTPAVYGGPSRKGSRNGPQEPITLVSNEECRMTRSLKLSALVSLVAYVGGAAALLWKR
jgi:hypothetical protein